LRLPSELILDISAYLPLDGNLALKLTHSMMNSILSLELQRLRKDEPSDCARFAIRNYLMSPCSMPTHLRCSLCKALYPKSMFEPTGSRIC
ncbi:hypothetical protein GQ44DRAFT_560304, partial [Phaeosphaeriaceae sp. PMI808]